LAGGLAAIGSDGFQFCQRHQLSKASFYYWRSKLEDPQGGRKSSFVSVRASVDPSPLASIHYPNGVRVDVLVGRVNLGSNLRKLNPRMSERDLTSFQKFLQFIRG
jgi:hypothetical protein